MRTFITISIVLALALSACGKKEEKADANMAPADKILAAMDKDGDKLVSKTEYEGHFADIDSDGNGSLSKDEMSTHHQEYHGNTDNIDQHFAQADSNKDGNINKDEFLAGFAKMDKDGDGQIMRGEILQHIKPTR